MPSLREVAKAAGVSTVTASSVLSGANRVRVSVETAKRIHETARNMNYVPRAAARGLRTGRTQVIGFINSPQTHWQPHWQEILRGVSDLLWDREERMILSLPRSEEQEVELLRQLAFGHQVDGLVVQNIAADDERVKMLKESKVPFVSVNGEAESGAHIVAFDNEEFASLLTTDALKDGGALALVSGKMRGPSDEEFLRGCQTAAEEAGVPFLHWDGAFLPDADWLGEARKKAGEKPLALVLTRQLLPELIGRMREGGLALGDDIGIRYLAGVDEVVLPPKGLTVVPVDHYTLGREAGKLLFSLIDKDDDTTIDPERRLILPGTARRLMAEAAVAAK